jgi:hypothetical protein
MNVALYIVYPYEPFQFETLRRHLPEAEYLVGYHGRSNDRRTETIELLQRNGLPYREIGGADLNQYGAYVLRYYTCGELLFPVHTRRVRMMYGYANKNNSTFSPENALYDLILSYGPWATRNLEPYAPVAEVGNHRLDRAFPLDRCSLKSGERPTVLYLPTVSYSNIPEFNFSSADPYLASLAKLAEQVNLSVKLHPDTVLYNPELTRRYNELTGVKVLNPYDDVVPEMARATAVISDFSGAVFESMALGVPVVLCRCAAESPFKRGRCFLSLNEQEDLQLYRELGVHNFDPRRLVEDVFRAIELGPVPDEVFHRYYRPDLLDGNSGARGAQAIRETIRRPPPRSNTQVQSQMSLYRSGMVPFKDAAHYAVELGRKDLLDNVLELQSKWQGKKSVLANSSRSLRCTFRVGQYYLHKNLFNGSIRRQAAETLTGVLHQSAKAHSDNNSSAGISGVSQHEWLAAQKYESDWWHGWLEEHGGNDDEWLAYVLRSFGIRDTDQFAGKVLVDVGGGPIGILTKLSGTRRIVVDPQATPSVDVTLERINAPGEEIPLPAGVADVVFMYNVLQHVSDPRRVLDECFRLVRPGGLIYLNDQLYVPTNEGHPHRLTEHLFQIWFLEHPLALEHWEVEYDRSYAGKSSIGEAILTAVLRRQ